MKQYQISIHFMDKHSTHFTVGFFSNEDVIDYVRMIINCGITINRQYYAPSRIFQTNWREV